MTIQQLFDHAMQKEKDQHRRLQTAYQFLKDVKQGRIYERKGLWTPLPPTPDALAYIMAEIEYFEKSEEAAGGPDKS